MVNKTWKIDIDSIDIGFTLIYALMIYFNCNSMMCFWLIKLCVELDHKLYIYID